MLEIKAFEETLVLIKLSYIILFYAAMSMPFTWGQAKIQVWGSLMS